MKKLLFIVLCCFCLCGCRKTYDGFEISNLYAEPFLTNKYYINGDIKNINGECNDDDTVTIKLDLIGNGDIRDTAYIDVECPKKGDKNHFYELISTDLETFKIKVNHIF